MQYEISNEILTVTVNDFGAELVSVKHKGKELLWQNQTGSWSGHAPILFPLCGRCQLWHNGKQYPITKHGFARDSLFELVEQTTTSVTFVLRSNNATRNTYPWEFDFFATYIVKEDLLEISWRVLNKDTNPLYFYCGGHEAHYLDDTLGNYRLVFDCDEVFDNLANDDGILNGQRTTLTVGKILDVPHQAIAKRESIILGNLNSSKVTLQHKDGTKVFEETFENFSNMLLWSPDGIRALCVEPWQNLPDSHDNATVDFAQKPNVQKVEVGCQATVTRTIRYF